MKIDNFALTMHQTCPAKYNLRMNEGWTTRRKSGALGFGSTAHSGLAVWYKTGDLAQSLRAITEAWPSESPSDDYRTLEKCISVMVEYTKAYPTESFRVIGHGTESPMVEVAFTLETGMYLSCKECGPIAGAWDKEDKYCKNCGEPLEPIEYGGIFDTVVEFGGQAFVLEHKTTSQLGSYYFNQYKPNNQVTGYVWAARKLSGKRVGGAIINAIGVFKVGATKFQREITSRSDADIETWLDNVRAVCEEIQWHNRTGTWPMRTSACVLYGQCEYHSVHVLDNPVAQQKRLEQDYVRDHWDYEKRT